MQVVRCASAGARVESRRITSEQSFPTHPLLHGTERYVRAQYQGAGRVEDVGGPLHEDDLTFRNVDSGHPGKHGAHVSVVPEQRVVVYAHRPFGTGREKRGDTIAIPIPARRVVMVGR